ncbi:aldo/keto reductase [Irregularibacter muris]|uniref:Aldo/keto reductase n=1 Tax=Irregularibacter muris TaxID=1796619 RepID=A0AAE3HCX9_9FIRM|nr:aldo/keto reductase [Irregularibacter muris]MCR1897951.1 aldo/keto reductase [Irregularibacter muris]
MEYNELGKTGMKVSKLCFGGLTVGPLQANLSPEEGGKIIARAMEEGVNFIDTADLYHTYFHIKKAMEYSKKELIISTKSYDYEKSGAEKNFLKALNQLGRDYIDIFMLHEQESLLTIQGHWEAMEYFIGQKDKGNIRAVGISTHRVEAVYAAADIPELDIIHPIININGIGIDDGSREDMEEAIAYAKGKGKGIYGMKPLGGGNLLHNIEKCFDYILGLDTLDSIAVGMQSEEEVLYNVHRFNGQAIPSWIKNNIDKKPRKLLVDFWCEGCGNCERKCTHDAIKVVDGKAQVDREKCVLCGYCGAYCPQFCIKVI